MDNDSRYKDHQVTSYFLLVLLLIAKVSSKCLFSTAPIYLPHLDCEKFCQCINDGQVVVQSCPSILRWNVQPETCDWPANVQCSTN
ncbi:hypothetical protein TSAR_005985 [Trichomalopsis sarcophagae]|uniref:Chitin-binding type-2 domain-containing protein n=1 Tax=Trichomalopsis sarcophagae TaxID=543379 RepID=A0A232FDD4_9HYME|nr:hypothetical protein TSAR_005985 [Trichomalopsis sarcophagae]